MNKEERDKLKHEVYTLWYHEKDQAKKTTFQKILDLLDFTDEVRSRLKAVEVLFQEIV
tara:strand:- start:72 stop:245 length:174 start_codon:yes stop_codon:yes gene_type:complete